MRLTRHTIAAGLATLSLAATASPALAQGGPGGGGGGGGGGGTSGGGGGGRPPSCTRTLIDPVMQVFVVTCTQARV